MTADGAQVVQQGQQYERHVAPAAQDALEIGRQLHHRAHQRIESLREMTFLGEVVDQVTGDLSHLLREERRTVNLGNAQRSVDGVEMLLALTQESQIVLLLAECLESCARFVELACELTRDDMQGLR